MKGIPSGKIGPKSVAKSSRGSNPAHNSGGTPGKSMPQGPIPGPERTGGPISLKRALIKKAMPSKGL